MTPVRLPSWLDAFDERAERAVVFPAGSTLDTVAHGLSAAADRSRLWIALAAARALRNRPGDRRAALRMVAVVGVESAVVHGAVKRLFGRRRPTRETVLRLGARRPPSSAFPSGHAASAATAAVLLGEGTRLAPGLLGLGALVAWSRVQTGLHHVSDVVVGFVLGLAVGGVAVRVLPGGAQGRLRVGDGG